MSDLIPEKRLNRLGRLVTKWVRGDNNESTVSPKLNAAAPTITSSSGTSVLEDARDAKERDALGDDLFAVLKVDMQRRIAGYGADYPKTDADNTVINRVFDKVMGFETSTLRTLKDHYHGTGKDLLLLVENLTGEEQVLREKLHYSEPSEYRWPKGSDLDTARTALCFSDLSVFPKGTDEYAMCKTMLGIVVSDRKNQSGRKYESMHQSVRQTSLLELGKTMKEYPDRLESIANYISDRGLLIREIEHWHLREYLATPAPSLSEGFL